MCQPFKYVDCLALKAKELYHKYFWRQTVALAVAIGAWSAGSYALGSYVNTLFLPKISGSRILDVPVTE